MNIANMGNQIRINLPFFFFRCPRHILPAHKRYSDSEGFTVVEIMIILAIIGVMASIAVPILVNYRNKAKIVLAVSEIKMFEKEIQNYELDNMRYPDELSETRIGNISDPWGNPYQYLKIPEDDDGESEEVKGKKEKDKKKSKPRESHPKAQANSDFDLYSKGKDEKSKTSFTSKESHDDIVRANDGHFIGLVSDF